MYLYTLNTLRSIVCSNNSNSAFRLDGIDVEIALICLSENEKKIEDGR